MKIYVVKPGDTPWSIARRFGVSEAKLDEVNGLEAQPHLVLGQALVIPENLDFKPGRPNYGVAESNGFILPSTPAKETQILKESAPYLTYLAAFSHHVRPDGSLEPIEDGTINNIGKANRDGNMLSVSNITGTVGSNFDTALADKILKSESIQQNLINNIIETLRAKGYYGVIVDFERISPANRELYNNFLRKLASRVHQERKVIATALAPKVYDIKTGSWHGAHDYRAHGQIVDFVIIMTYEWGWSGGPPMAVAPLNEVRKVINYAVSVIPRKKIMMGMPLYGYDWTLPYEPGGEFAESIGPLEAVVRAAKVGAVIKYDLKSQSPTYNYFKNRVAHVVWFEDPRSVAAKYKLVSEYGLRGVSFWTLGNPFPQNWYILNNMFRITKVVR